MRSQIDSGSTLPSLISCNPSGTQFTFEFIEDTRQEVINSTWEAAEIWSSILKDNVNIKIDFEFGDLIKNGVYSTENGCKNQLIARKLVFLTIANQQLENIRRR